MDAGDLRVCEYRRTCGKGGLSTAVFAYKTDTVIFQENIREILYTDDISELPLPRPDKMGQRFHICKAVVIPHDALPVVDHALLLVAL